MATTPVRTAPDSARPRHRFTVEEYHRMVEAGILDEDDRVELVGGEIVEMSADGRPARRLDQPDREAP